MVLHLKCLEFENMPYIFKTLVSHAFRTNLLYFFRRAPTFRRTRTHAIKIADKT